MREKLSAFRHSKESIYLIVLAYFSFLTVAYTFPLIFHMADSVVGKIGDNIYFVWLIGWFQKALFTLHVNPFFHPGLNYPEGWNVAMTETTPAMVLLALPGSLLFGPTWGYNFAILASFVLAGWSAFLAVKKLTDSPLAGLIAGTLFAFSPYRWARYLVGHLNLLGNFWFPFYFVAITEYLLRGRWTWLLIAGLLALGIGLSSPYYLYMGLIITAVFALALIFFYRKTLVLKTTFLRSGVLLITLLITTLIAMLPYLVSNSQGNLADRSLQYANSYSASPLDFILPVNFYLGETVWDWAGRSLEHENALYLGIVCLVLVGLAWLKRWDLQQSPWIGAALVASLAGIILAMGIYLHIQDTTWVWHIPRALRPILDRDTLRIPLPGYFLFQYLPFYTKMRVMMRFGVFTLTLMSMLAGLGSVWLFRKYPTWRYLIAVVLLVCIVLDVYPGVQDRFSKVEARPVDVWLAAQPGNGAVVQFPISRVEDQDLVYDTLIHGKPFIGGYFSANQPKQYRRIKPVLTAFPDEASVALLKGLNFQYILVEASYYPNFSVVHQRIEELGLVLQTVVGDQYVYTWP